METVCKNCDYWKPEAPVVAKKENYGECDKLGHITETMHPDYILPVLNDGKLVSDAKQKEVEYITMANFGCNQFRAAA